MIKTKSNEEIDAMSIEELKKYAKELSQEMRFSALVEGTNVDKMKTMKEHLDSIIIIVESYKNKTK